MKKLCARVVQCAALCVVALASTAAFAAFEPFVVRNFRVEGAQRIAEGTIYNYLPINIGDTELALNATLDTVTEDGKAVGQIWLSRPEFHTLQRYGVLESLPRAVDKTWEMITFTVSILAHMVMGEVSLKNMSGPLSIADIAGSAAAAGLVYFLSVLAAVSVSLGILNLLPIPLLDGGQIVYQIAEWIKGAPLSERAMVLGQQIGIFFVIALTGFAFYNDIVRMFG